MEGASLIYKCNISKLLKDVLTMRICLDSRVLGLHQKPKCCVCVCKRERSHWGKISLFDSIEKKMIIIECRRFLYIRKIMNVKFFKLLYR